MFFIYLREDPGILRFEIPVLTKSSPNPPCVVNYNFAKDQV